MSAILQSILFRVVLRALCSAAAALADSLSALCADYEIEFSARRAEVNPEERSGG